MILKMGKRSVVITICLIFTSIYLGTTQTSAASWGAWSGWQDSPVSSSGSRQVETRQVEDSYTMETYVYTDESSPSGRGYWPNATNRTLRNHAVETWSKGTLDSARWVINPGTYYDSPDNNNCDGMVHDAKGYVVVEGQGHDYVPFFKKGTNYKTQYRYRDEIKTESGSGGASNQQTSGGTTNSGDNSNKADNANQTKPSGANNTPSNTSNTTGQTANKSSGSQNMLVNNSAGSGKKAKTSKSKKKLSTVSITKTTASTNKIKVCWKKGKNCIGYKICCSTNIRFKNCKVVMVKKSGQTSVWLRGLKPGTKYYIRIRTCRKSKGKTTYSRWSARKCVRTKKVGGSVKKKSAAKKKNGKKKTVKMYVITKVEKKYATRRHGTQHYTLTFSYNKDGKITKIVNKQKGLGDSVSKRIITYQNDRILKSKETYKSLNDSYTMNYKYKYDGAGRVIKITGNDTIALKYNKNGKCIKMTEKGCQPVRFKYNKNGLLKTIGTTSLYYDNHGMLKLIEYSKDPRYAKYKCRNTYKKGRLTKSEATYGLSYHPYITYHYKKITVLKEKVAQIKDQQRWILFNDAIDHFSYPPLEACYMPADKN